MNACVLAPVAAILAVGCASDPVPGDGLSPAGAPIEVRLLSGGFVECDGRRETLEEFVYEVRMLCRNAQGDPAELPWLRVLVSSDPSVDVGDAFDRLRSAAYDAGIRQVEFVVEGE